MLDGILFRMKSLRNLDKDEPSCLLRGSLPLSRSIPAATAALVLWSAIIRAVADSVSDACRRGLTLA